MTSPPELAAATEETLTVTGPVMVQLVVPPSTAFLLSQVAEGSSTAFLAVEEISAERNPGVVYDVFINLPEGQPGNEADAFYAGTFTLFGIEAMNDPDHAHDGATGLRHTFDATGLIRSLATQSLWNSESVTVTVEPVPPAGEEMVPSDVPVNIGRISLFVASDDPLPVA